MEVGQTPTAPKSDTADYLEGTGYRTVNNGYIPETVYGLRSEVRLLLDWEHKKTQKTKKGHFNPVKGLKWPLDSAFSVFEIGRVE